MLYVYVFPFNKQFHSKEHQMFPCDVQTFSSTITLQMSSQCQTHLLSSTYVKSRTCWFFNFSLCCQCFPFLVLFVKIYDTLGNKQIRTSQNNSLGQRLSATFDHSTNLSKQTSYSKSWCNSPNKTSGSDADPKPTPSIGFIKDKNQKQG